MCMEDIRIGRKTNSNEQLRTATQGVNLQMVGPNENRIALIVKCCDANNINISTIPMTAQAQGIILPATAPLPLVMTIEEYGDMVTKPWYVFGGTTGTYTVIEVFLNDK